MKKGFTLVELLVVISIIGVLSSIVMTSIDTSRSKAIDARRKSDMYQLELAIQLYYNDNGSFPDNATTFGGDWPAGFKAQLAPYIQLPMDPIGNHPGRYYGAHRMTWAPDASCNGQYVVWMYLENGVASINCGFSSGEYFRLLGKY